ncbi:MAG: AEC family transporter [Deltaproteobacteria bacterium]|nr:AEC family transporter [Deltaproteobacteria bacterium]
MDIFLRTTLPLFLLIGLGFFSRKADLMKQGDERTLSAYVYFFALPSLFFINLAETRFDRIIATFVGAGIIPVLVIFSLLTLLYFIFRFSKDTYFLLVLGSVFGSHAFFGVPFVMFALPTAQGEQLATLSSGTISIVSVVISISVLELHQLSREKRPSVLEAVRHVARRLTRNPLVISIFSGAIFSYLKVPIPVAVSKPIHMLGGTTATVAIFMLGVFFYGRQYKQLTQALGVSLLRMIVLPLIAFGTVRLLGLETPESSVVVLMNAMPMAVSMVILSERYRFHQELIASIVLISSVLAGFYLNGWLAVLGLE